MIVGLAAGLDMLGGFEEQPAAELVAAAAGQEGVAEARRR